MKAMTANDTCFSTLKKGRYSSVFNTDGREREVIDVAEARTAFDFKIEKHQSFDENGNALPGHFHLRRDTDGAFIPTGAIGDRFVPVQHLDVFDYIVNKVMPEVPQMKLETVGHVALTGSGNKSIIRNRKLETDETDEHHEHDAIHRQDADHPPDAAVA